jgi:hypothetical protein
MSVYLIRAHGGTRQTYGPFYNMRAGAGPARGVGGRSDLDRDSAERKEEEYGSEAEHCQCIV